jgi:predicted small integral membrane protein
MSCATTSRSVAFERRRWPRKDEPAFDRDGPPTWETGASSLRIAGLLVFMTIWEIAFPRLGAKMRHPGQSTSRGDRLFISLISAALCSLGLIGTPLWGASRRGDHPAIAILPGVQSQRQRLASATRRDVHRTDSPPPIDHHREHKSAVRAPLSYAKNRSACGNNQRKGQR